MNSADLPQQHVCKEEEVLADHQMCVQERSSGLDQEEPELPQMKEEQEDLCGSQEGEQLVLKCRSRTLAGERPCVCQTCGRRFSFKCQLAEHLRIHTSEKPFYCGICGKDFRRTTYLRRHMRIHVSNYGCHADLPQKQDEDVLSDQQLCNQERTSGLDQEEPEPPQIKEEQQELCSSREEEQLAPKQESDTLMLTPTYQERDSGSSTDEETTPNKRRPRNRAGGKGEGRSSAPQGQFNSQSGRKCIRCDVCGKTFRRQNDMKCHYMIHTGERPHACLTCDRRFIHRYQLVEHTRIHTGEMPFYCGICGRDFRRITYLKQHMRVHVVNVGRHTGHFY